MSPPPEDLEPLLAAHRQRSRLRFIACGSVDDGKSTLIGRLLYESRAVHDDHLAALAVDSKRSGTRGGELDFALLVDGLTAEREQGITIDVAYRAFSTAKRHFIVADAPGHEQYTRNMVTGASTADLGVVLVDARKGVLTQTRRHTHILSLLGVRRVVLAVNKMDLMGWSEARFAEICNQYRELVSHIGRLDVTAIPLCAADGDNVVRRSPRTPWYSGPTLLEHLESVEPGEDLEGKPFRMPVQAVHRPSPEFRGFAGLIATGTVRPGDPVRVMPSGRESRVARIVTADGDLAVAIAGRSVTLTLDSEVDVSRGDVLVSGEPCPVADQIEATIIWLHAEPLLQGRSYDVKLGTRTVPATVMPIKYRFDVDTLGHLSAERLELNEIGVGELTFEAPVALEPYEVNRALGGFLLLDRRTHDTVGAGLCHFALRRSSNVRWQTLDVDKRARAAQKGQRPLVVWLTGLSGAGKSTIANIVEKKFLALGRHTYLLDGDNVRHGLNKGLGFTAQDRVENVRRLAEVARLMVDAGLIVLVSAISPFRSERAMARGLFEPGEFVEVFVDVPLAVAEQRDAKGLYAKARRGELKNFTGIDSPYEPPEAAELVLDAAKSSAEECADRILEALARPPTAG